MKSIALILIFAFVYSAIYSQNEVNMFESSLGKLDSNVPALNDELGDDDSGLITGQSLFEDRKGISAVFLPYGGMIRINTSDASVQLSFANRVSNKKFFYGFEISGKTNDGFGALISGGKLSPGAKVNGVIGIQELMPKSNTLDSWLVLKIGYEGTAFKLFDDNNDFSKQIRRISFNSLISSFSVNLKIGGDKLLAASAGFQNVNNYDDLGDIELADKTIITNANSNTIRTYENKMKVKVGDYITYYQVPLNLDFFWVPSSSSRIGLYHFWRGRLFNEGFNNGLGTGFYLLHKNNPLYSIAGIVFEIEDVAKLKDGFGENLTINFVVGFNFGFAKK